MVKGNTGRKVTRELMAKLPEDQTNKRGITVDGMYFRRPTLETATNEYIQKDHLVMKGTNGTIFAIGDCTASQYAPTAQVASQQGAYLARQLKQLAKRDGLREQLSALQQQVLLRGENDEEGKKVKAEAESLAKQLEKASKLRPFHYSHQGSLALVSFLFSLFCTNLDYVYFY